MFRWEGGKLQFFAKKNIFSKKFLFLRKTLSARGAATPLCPPWIRPCTMVLVSLSLSLSLSLQSGTDKSQVTPLHVCRKVSEFRMQIFLNVCILMCINATLFTFQLSFKVRRLDKIAIKNIIYWHRYHKDITGSLNFQQQERANRLEMVYFVKNVQLPK